MQSTELRTTGRRFTFCNHNRVTKAWSQSAREFVKCFWRWSDSKGGVINHYPLARCLVIFISIEMECVFEDEEFDDMLAEVRMEWPMPEQVSL